MKPHIHAESSVKTYGGKPSDYLGVHKFLDSSKGHFGDCRHRAILHSTFGCYLAEMIFGETLTNSDGKVISVREVCEQHILEDLGILPTVQDWLTSLPIQSWMISQSIREACPDVKSVEIRSIETEPSEIESLKTQIKLLEERVRVLEGKDGGFPFQFPIDFPTEPISPKSPYDLPPVWPRDFPTVMD